MKALFRWLSPTGAGARLQIFIFHRVLAAADPLMPDEVSAAQFDAVCGWIRRWFQVLPLGEASRLLGRGELPARAAAITFDDGYADNHDIALPILARHGLGATFFIATGYLDGGRMWNDTIIESVRQCPHDSLDLGALGIAKRVPLGDAAQRLHAAALLIDAFKYMPPSQRLSEVDRLAVLCGARPPDDLMMRSNQVIALRRAGMEIGGHTATHPILARVEDAEARQEIRRGREQLQTLLDEAVEVFAYPNGRPGQDYLPQHVAMVRDEGFTTAVSTAWGPAHAGSDLFQLPRFTPWDRQALRFGARLARQYWAARQAGSR